MNSRISYFLSSVLKKLSKHEDRCPYCNTNLADGRIVDRKYFVTSLVECPVCSMFVRLPTDSVEESKNFYQSEYSQGYTTDCPSEAELKEMMSTNFVGSERDYSRYLHFFKDLNITIDRRILDFGCSWGYGLYQMQKIGYRAEGFEISAPRLKYGIEKLGVTIHSRGDHLVGMYDVIFSSHVMEHLPDFTLINHLFNNQLKPGGYFIAITPNGSEEFMQNDYQAYHQLWGKVHPVLLSDLFVKRNFGDQIVYMNSWGSLNHEVNAILANHSMANYELVYVLKK